MSESSQESNELPNSSRGKWQKDPPFWEGESMISYREARDILIRYAHSFGAEQIGLGKASGRVLTETILADRDYPPFNRATMDGFAIQYRDWEQGIRHFSIIETIFAGSLHSRPIGSGECYKIMTGAPVPDGANLVIRREDTEEGNGMMQIRENIPLGKPYLNIARQGEDLHMSDPVIARPVLCEPPVVALLASLGKQKVEVAKLPRVALFTTGNEVVAIDEPVNAAQIRNSNYWFLQASLHKWGIMPDRYQHVLDDKSALQEALGKVLSSDMIILSGGVSAGDADYVPEILEASGVRKIFHKIAIKPGKPVWCGATAEGGLVFALPGNPFSCMVGFTLLIQPWLHSCFGLPVPTPFGLPLQMARKKKTPLDEFFPVRMTGSPAGASPVALNGSGDIRMGLDANALALHPAESGDLAEGEIVLCYPIG
jgi:molybdopterin molybdotransferase